MSSVEQKLKPCPTCAAPCEYEVKMRGGDYGWSTTDEQRTFYKFNAAALREQPEALGVVDDDPISVYKAYAKGVNAGMGGLLPDSTESLLAEAVEVGTLCNLAAEDTLDAGMTAIADALSKAALTITNLGRTVAALTAAQQPVQEGGGEVCPRCKGAGEYEGFARHTSGDPQDEYAATVQCEPCEGTGEVAAPPSAPVGVPVAQVRRSGKGAPHDALYAGLIPRGPATPEVKEGDLLYLAQQPAQAAPGWKLVPVVATPEMLEAATGLFKSVGLYGCYNAMLAAAPTPPGDDAAGGA